MTEKKQQKLIKKASIYIDKNRFDKAARCLRSAYTENGKFKFNPRVKSALTNSVIYNEIRSKKGLI